MIVNCKTLKNETGEGRERRSKLCHDRPSKPTNTGMISIRFMLLLKAFFDWLNDEDDGVM